MSILLLNKEKDMTSFSAVKQAQKELGFKKAGHGGTLDPLATGVLPIFFEQSTKFLQFFNSETKEYIADFIFGISSNTEDITGVLTYDKTNKEPKEIEIQRVLKKFEGIVARNSSHLRFRFFLPITPTVRRITISSVFLTLYTKILAGFFL
mgnify:CR=1 FL=1